MQSNAIVITKIIGTKIKGTLAFNQSSCCSEWLHLHSSNFSDNVHSTRINHQAQAYKANKQAYTKNKAPIKIKALKERTKR
jgi:hypothetical protein